MLFFPIFQPEGDFIIQQASDVAGLEGTTLMAADGLMVSNFMEIPETKGMYFSGPDLRYGFNKNQRVIGSSPDSFLSGYVGQYGEKPSAAFWAHSSTPPHCCLTPSRRPATWTTTALWSSTGPAYASS